MRYVSSEQRPNLFPVDGHKRDRVAVKADKLKIKARAAFMHQYHRPDIIAAQSMRWQVAGEGHAV